MSGKRVSHARRRRGGSKFLAFVVALLLVAGALGWSVHTLLSNGGVFSEPSGGSRPGPQNAAAETMSECASQLAQADAVVAAARAGVATWRAHVQARTDMLQGRISEKEMEAVWDRTKATGPHEQERFTAASARYVGTAACDRLSSGSPTATSRRCIDRSSAADAAVTTARAAMAEWSDHLHHMATFADGGMSTGHAQHLWIAAWRKAPTNIAAFEESAAALSAAPPCTVS